MLARLRLAHTPGVTPRAACRLVAACGSARAGLAAGRGTWKRVLGAARTDALAAGPSEDDARRELARVRRGGAQILVPGSAGWPESLDELSDPPLILHALGDLVPADVRGVAIVGARRASAYGRSQARRLATELAALGITVVSGMARGVDGAAHRAALDAGGRTVAVLGAGLARPYPPEHAALMGDISRGGVVLTEFALDMPPLAHHFPRRNRLLAALSRAVIVVEAGERSGSLITADHALDLGRDVLAVPGRVDSPGSRGTHRLLREGAALCDGVADVLRALGLEPDETTPDAGERELGRTATERRLLAALRGEDLDADALLEAAGVALADGLAAITALELRNVVRLGADGRYSRS